MSILDGLALDMLLQGHSKKDSGHWLARELYERGYSKDDSYRIIMQDFAAQCDWNDEPYGDNEVRATLDSVFASAPFNPGRPTRTAGRRRHWTQPPPIPRTTPLAR